MEGLAKAAGHADRNGPLKSYCTGLLFPGNARVWNRWRLVWLPTMCGGPISRCTTWWRMRPGATKPCCGRCGSTVLAAMRQKDQLVAWIVDDTGFLKKGKHSVGVARQYCGQVGKQENCRVAVSLSVPTRGPVCRWLGACICRRCGPRMHSGERRRGSRKRLRFQTKPAIALQQIRQAVEEEVPPAPVLADAAYGNDSQFREAITELGLNYVLGVQSSTTVWKPGEGPLPKKEWRARGASAALAEESRSIARCRSSKWRWRFPPQLGKAWCGGKEQPEAPISFCGPPRSSGPSGLLESSTTSGGVATYRMAQDRPGTNQVLVFHFAA